MSGNSSVHAIVEQATVKAKPSAAEDARLCLFDSQPDALADALRADLAGLKFSIEYRSPEELMLTLHGRRFVGETEAFAAAEAFVQTYGLDAAEPEIFFTAMPVDQTDNLEGMEQFPFCWADPEPALGKLWALETMRVPQAWAFAEARGRPSRGEGIVVAQPDTGITKHAELTGVTIVSPRNLLSGKPNDPTDPLPKTGNPGHGTSTASVLLSPETLDISGSAPDAKHMPIRAIESVARLSQIKVAEAIDHAVNNGAHVITMSLGGLASLSLWLALSRAVDSGVIVLAAAGNCVGHGRVAGALRQMHRGGRHRQQGRALDGQLQGPEIDISAPGAERLPRHRAGQGRRARPGNELRGGADRRRRRLLAGLPRPRQRGERRKAARRDGAGHVPPHGRGDGARAGRMGQLQHGRRHHRRRGAAEGRFRSRPRHREPDRSGAEGDAGEFGEKPGAGEGRRGGARRRASTGSATAPRSACRCCAAALCRSRRRNCPASAKPVETPVGGAVFEAGGAPLESAGETAAAPSPAIRRGRADMPAFRKLGRQKEIIARRAAVEAGGSLESAARAPTSRCRRTRPRPRWTA